MKIKTAHLRDFLNQYHREEISFSMMVHLLNEVAQDNWISVEDDPPKEVTPVIVFGPCCDVCNQKKIAEIENREWFDSETGEKLKFKPTHYQPLPADPKGKEDTNG